MSGTAEVLQEYLIKLGYKVDEPGLKKFSKGLDDVGKRVFGIGTAVAGAVIAVESAAAAFAYSMRKVYFDSQLAGSSVQNLKSLEFAGQKFGISAEKMGDSIHSMAQAMRLNPGLQGLVESFGIRVSGRDVSDVMKDYVAALDKLPEFQAAQYAGMFGIDPDTYHLMRGHIAELNAEVEKMKSTFASLGVDLDASAKESKEYANSLDDIKMHFQALETTILSHSLPAFKMFSQAVNNSMDTWTKFINRTNNYSVKEVAEALIPKTGELGWLANKLGLGGGAGGVTLTPEAKARLALAQRSGGGVVTQAPAAATTTNPGDFASIEAKYGLPAGMLDHVYSIESNRGKSLRSPKGALGPFQFMPKTGKDYGLNSEEDMMDLGKSSDAAGRYLSKLLKQYGSTDGALAAYNWGPGNLDKGGMDHLPAETQAYLQKYHALDSTRLGAAGSGLTVQQTNTTTIHVSGSDAGETAGKVAGAQTRVFADALRDGIGAIR